MCLVLELLRFDFEFGLLNSLSKIVNNSSDHHHQCPTIVSSISCNKMPQLYTACDGVTCYIPNKCPVLWSLIIMTFEGSQQPESDLSSVILDPNVIIISLIWK